MGIGEIPVQMLTHLIVAFAYISEDFKITNMDGVSSDVYRDVGNVKSRNPNVKVMIALGGWAFSDPGPWQSVFPDMVSSKDHRATFIKNLLGFLNEYGYDGVDFDWEYPGADDRGGSKSDAANYVALVKELRQAVDDSGRELIVTFTAPTSYWYLRHFDVAEMEKYVDWINLMSYDLHGVWDSSNPIGNQVLAHTNLTEIDMALDLFWRVDVKPSSIVLGLGFYGRSFQLEDSSCWKPGCGFNGPGKAGSCSNTPGILSYREIQQIVSGTGATAYLDRDAQARYMVYDDDSWISFDDETTFKAKIEYANKMGLSGLMAWAVDLDDARLTALSSISNHDLIDAGSIPFSLVDLKYIFPEYIRPEKQSDAKFGLVTYGGSSSAARLDPQGSPFGLLVSGRGPKGDGVRIDYSNAPGYWDLAVDSPGIDSDGKEKRFHAHDSDAWSNVLDKQDIEDLDFLSFDRDVSAPLYFGQTSEYCEYDGEDYTEGIAAYVTGFFNASLGHSFSAVGYDLDTGAFEIDQVAGFLALRGTSDLTFGISGIGNFGFGWLDQNAGSYEPHRYDLEGQTVDTSWGGQVHFQPWWSVSYRLMTSDGSFLDSGDIELNGNLSMRVVADFGDFVSIFPSPDEDEVESAREKRPKNRIAVSANNSLNSNSGKLSRILMYVDIQFGLDTQYLINGILARPLPNMFLSHQTSVAFDVYPGDTDDTSCVDYSASTKFSQNATNYDDENWTDGQTYLLDRDEQRAGQDCFGDKENGASKRSQLGKPSTGTNSVASAEVDDASLVPRLKAHRAGSFVGWLPNKPAPLELMIGDAYPIYKNEPSGMMGGDDATVSCLVGEDKDPGSCGCVPMMATYRFYDMDDCDSCIRDNGWPSGNVKDPDAVLLEAEKAPRAGRATKFPGGAQKKWEGIQGGRWDHISRYWGNSSQSCTNWNVTDLKTDDWEISRRKESLGTFERASYHTEHVFEGQLIGDFFDWWLAEGQIRNQSPKPSRITRIHDCEWTQKYVYDEAVWLDPLTQLEVNFADYIGSEIGSEEHKDRLTIYKSRPNRIKGNLFTGIRPHDPEEFKKKESDGQLSSVKEFGMTFSYLNNPKVWKKFCDPYEAIYEKMGEFEEWYNEGRNPTRHTHLQSQWKSYIEEVLRSIVNRSKADFDNYYSIRKAQDPDDVPYYQMWEINREVNRNSIKFDNGCDHLEINT